MKYPKCSQGAGRAVIVDDQNRLLLVRGNGDGSFWSLPGGRADLGEDIKACVVRETYEETGLRVRVGEFFAVCEFYDENIGFHVLEMMFHASIESGSVDGHWVDPDGPIEESRFFSLDEICNTIQVAPEFLKKGDWLLPQTNQFYRGIEYRDSRPGKGAQ